MKKRITSILLVFVFVLASVALIIGNSRKKEEEPVFQTEETEETTSDIFTREEKEPTITVEEIIGQIVTSPSDSVVKVSDPTKFSAEKAKLSGAGNLVAEGYRTTDLPYDGNSFVIAKMKAGFTLPDKFSLRDRTVKKLEQKQTSDYAKFEAVYTDATEARPAMEMYMGFIFVDNGESIDVYSNTGRFLTSFNDTDYIPAYTRDASGNPLFYRMTTVGNALWDGFDIEKEKKITRVREPHEKENSVLVEGKIKGLDTEKEEYKKLTEDELKEKIKEEVKKLLEVGNEGYEETKAYYYLSGSGYFAPSDYDDSVDGRGVYFDYPAYYGLSDSGLKLYAEKYNEYKKTLDSKIDVKHKIAWNYKLYDTKISEKPFDRAYNFSEGLGCVVTEEYYQDGGLFFVNSSGNSAFKTLDKYNDTKIDKYLISNYMTPISEGPESIGYFYYDHRLVRVRRETIDYFNYQTNNKILVFSSDEVLIDKSGKIFPVPVGYKIKSYSDGIICLERDGKYGYMDYTGAWIAEPVYSYASPFSEGLGVLKTADGRCGVIDTVGNVVLPFAYKSISTCSDGVFVAYSDDAGWEIMRKMTK